MRSKMPLAMYLFSTSWECWCAKIDNRILTYRLNLKSLTKPFTCVMEEALTLETRFPVLLHSLLKMVPFRPTPVNWGKLWRKFARNQGQAGKGQLARMVWAKPNSAARSLGGSVVGRSPYSPSNPSRTVHPFSAHALVDVFRDFRC